MWAWVLVLVLGQGPTPLEDIETAVLAWGAAEAGAEAGARWGQGGWVAWGPGYWVLLALTRPCRCGWAGVWSINFRGKENTVELVARCCFCLPQWEADLRPLDEAAVREMMGLPSAEYSDVLKQAEAAEAEEAEAEERRRCVWRVAACRVVGGSDLLAGPAVGWGRLLVGVAEVGQSPAAGRLLVGTVRELVQVGLGAAGGAPCSAGLRPASPPAWTLWPDRPLRHNLSTLLQQR